jgi:hypothetical protein
VWGAGDQGVDIVVNPRGERVAVQCKNYSKPVGNRPVQEVYAGARYHRCAAAWVVAPAGYTRGALALAQSTGVSLYDANTIHRWIKNVDKLKKERGRVTAGDKRPRPHRHARRRRARGGQKEALLVPTPRRPAGVSGRFVRKLKTIERRAGLVEIAYALGLDPSIRVRLPASKACTSTRGATLRGTLRPP